MKSVSRFFLILSCVAFTLFSGCKKESTDATLTIKVLDPNNKLAAGIDFDIMGITDNFSYRNNKVSSSSLGKST